MAAKGNGKAKAAVKPVEGEKVRIVVLIPHDGLAKGYERDITFSARVQYMIDAGYWKLA